MKQKALLCALMSLMALSHTPAHGMYGYLSGAFSSAWTSWSQKPTGDKVKLGLLTAGCLFAAYKIIQISVNAEPPTKTERYLKRREKEEKETEEMKSKKNNDSGETNVQTNIRRLVGAFSGGLYTPPSCPIQ